MLYGQQREREREPFDRRGNEELRDARRRVASAVTSSSPSYILVCVYVCVYLSLAADNDDDDDVDVRALVR